MFVTGSINNAGQIAALGVNLETGEVHGLLLAPDFTDWRSHCQRRDESTSSAKGNNDNAQSTNPASLESIRHDPKPVARDKLDRMGRPSLPTMISRGWSAVEDRWRRGNGFLVFYCCAVPLTTTAKEGFSPVESSMLAEKVQWSWSSLDTATVVPPSD